LLTLVRGQASYCMDVGNTNGADATIGSVTLKGASMTAHSTKMCPITKLRDLTGKETADLIPGKTYTLKWTADTCGNNYSKWGKAWIDWYGEGWSGTAPYAQHLVSSMSGSTTFQIDSKFTVPTDAKYGKTRMRIMLEETTDETKLYPCAIFSYGGASDYSIVITDGSGLDNGGGGLSGGSVFLIILFVGGFCYLAGGIAYKYQVKGTRGIEMIPNLDFWRQLPKLFMDGCRFTLAKIMQVKAKLMGGGGGGGASSGMASATPGGAKTYDEI